MDTILIQEKLEYLNDNIKKLEFRYNKYKNETDELEKETLLLAISKLIEEIIESAIKINNTILKENKDYAASYYETFSRLTKHYGFNKKTFNELAKSTSLRNKITHEYKSIENKILLETPNLIKLYTQYKNTIAKQFL